MEHSKTYYRVRTVVRGITGLAIVSLFVTVGMLDITWFFQ